MNEAPLIPTPPDPPLLHEAARASSYPVVPPWPSRLSTKLPTDTLRGVSKADGNLVQVDLLGTLSQTLSYVWGRAVCWEGSELAANPTDGGVPL